MALPEGFERAQDRGSLPDSTQMPDFGDDGRRTELSPSQWTGPANAETRSGTLLASGLPLSLSTGTPLLPDDTPRRRLRLLLKRALDVIVAAIALVCFAPLIFIAAGLVFIAAPGPLFFNQRRLGLNGRFFTTYKIRTMYAHRGDPTGSIQTKVDDDRVTSIGRFIRQTSIDELPQFLNVLLGDMSMVGPRPHVEHMLAGGIPYEQLVPYYPLRVTMKPGITGWAQVNGFRGPTTDAALASARIDHDLAYIQNFSLLLDLKILLLTAWRELTRGTGF